MTPREPGAAAVEWGGRYEEVSSGIKGDRYWRCRGCGALVSTPMRREHDESHLLPPPTGSAR